MLPTVTREIPAPAARSLWLSPRHSFEADGQADSLEYRFFVGHGISA
jgi:hypothetical protein